MVRGLGKKNLKDRKNLTKEEKLEEALHKKGYNLSGSEKEDDLQSFLDTVATSQVNYSEYIKKRMDKHYNVKDVSLKENSNMYNQFLLLQCIAPLRRGVNPGNIAEAIGGYAALMVLDKNFRENAHTLIREQVAPHLDNYVRNNPNSRLKSLRDMMVEKGEVPLNPDSVAVMKIGMIKKAYEDLRNPELDKELVMSSWNQANELLYQQAEKDGMDRETVDLATRTLVGRLLERHPGQSVYFEELAYGDVQKSDPKQTVVFDSDGEAHRMSVWGGEFQTASGDAYVGGFTPRMPQGSDFHNDYMTTNTYDYFDKEGLSEDSLESYREETLRSAKPNYRYSGEDHHPTYPSKVMAKDDLTNDEFRSMSVNVSRIVIETLSGRKPDLWDDIFKEETFEEKEEPTSTKRDVPFKDFENHSNSKDDYDFEL